MKKVDERNNKQIKRIISENPHLSYAEAIRLFFIRKGERRKNKLANAPKNQAKRKRKKGKNDAVYKVLSSGFETNRRKH